MAKPVETGKQLMTRTRRSLGACCAASWTSRFTAMTNCPVPRPPPPEPCSPAVIVRPPSTLSSASTSASLGPQGFLTSIGGWITVPVGLPTNIAGLAVLSVRMTAAIAHLRGYDVEDPRVRSAVTLTILGEDLVRKLVAAGKMPASPLGVATAPTFDADLERQISERVMGSLTGRMSSKHLAVVVMRGIPLVGGGVGAVVDGWLTYGLGGYVKREFVARQQLTR